MLRKKPTNYGSAGEHKIAVELKNLSNVPPEIILKVSDFTSYDDLVVLSNVSKSMQIKTKPFDKQYRQKGILYFRKRLLNLNQDAIRSRQSIYDSLNRFQEHITKDNHVNIFSGQFNFSMAYYDPNYFGANPMATFVNYIDEMDRELTRYQWSPRSFIACGGKIGFENMEAKRDGNCLTQRCNKPCCFNNFCNPTLWLRCGTPQVLIGGATALLCPVPFLTGCLLNAAVMNCGIGLPAIIAHEYRLHKTRKEFEDLDIVKSARLFMLFQEKERKLCAGMDSIFTPQDDDSAELKEGPSPNEM